MKTKAKEVLNKKIPRIILLAFFDIIAVSSAEFLTSWMRFDFGHIPSNYFYTISNYLLVDTAIVLTVFALFRLYSSVWRYASIPELLSVIMACICSDLAIFTYKHILLLPSPRSFWFVFPIILIILTGAVRFSYRVARNIIHGLTNSKRSKNTMIIGAGEAAHLLIDEVRRSSSHDDLYIRCIIDDDRNKKSSRIRGIPIVGNRHLIAHYAEKFQIEQIIIAMPSVGKEEIAKIVTECQKTKAEIMILPSIHAMLHSGPKEIAQAIRPIKYEDFLGRDEIIVNNKEIAANLADKTILVTGGGGSIGSELCRQIAAAKPKSLIIFDIYENNAYDIQQELLRNFPELDLHVIIGSVRDYARLEKVFEEFHPQQVYHAAAHKHVPLMEVSPNEAIKNNCLGTLNAVKLANMYGTEKFVLVSTDKAVRPTNIMGASKRICEMIVQTWDKFSKTSFVAVRFGNVLGSNGSVIPLFLKQIEAGGPVTVTHKDITRFFMTISEAVSLILQASIYAEGGEIFVLDMGKPVRIFDLAKKIIRYKGFEPGKDIQIKITGLRPGEKLYEEMLMEEEGLKETPNKLIHIGRPLRIRDTFLEDLDELINAAQKNTPDIKTLTAKMVSTYKPAKEDLK